MVTDAPPPHPRRVFLRENRVATGVDVETIAAKVNMDRVSVYRWERKAFTGQLAAWKIAAYATAIGKQPLDMYRLPGADSLDAMVASASESTQTMAADIVRRITSSDSKE